MDIQKFLKQSTWRKVGAACIILATLMALYAVPGDVLRDSVIHLAQFISGEATGDVEPGRPALFCLLYWAVFALLICLALYLAMVDMRFIRLQYALEKKKLFQESMSEDFLDPVSAEALASKLPNRNAHDEADR